MTTKLIVYGGWEAFGVPDFSPACLKLKTYLRMAGIPYDPQPGDPRKGPTKKIPYVDDAGTILGDSHLIFEHLFAKHGNPLDANLTPRQRAEGHALRRVVEQSLYWVTLYARWVEDGPAAEMRQAFAPVLPPVIGGVVFGAIRGGTKKAAWAQGTARLPRAAVYQSGNDDLDCVSAMLGDRPFVLGDAPTSFDATVFAHVANALAFPSDSPVAQHGRTLENLTAYCGRMRARYWASAGT